MILMRILIYGAGVIGSLYAALFAEAGYDTTGIKTNSKISFNISSLVHNFRLYNFV